MTDYYKHLSVSDFDKYDCLKLTPLVYVTLIVLLRAYIVWLMSVTNMNDRVGIIQWLYPEQPLFYLNLASGVLGLFAVLVISLRRPDAAQWVQKTWPNFRVLLIGALFFDLFVTFLGYWLWALISVSGLAIQIAIITALSFFLMKNNRLSMNLKEFPEKLPEK